jgi:hypothetical protein
MPGSCCCQVPTVNPNCCMGELNDAWKELGMLHASTHVQKAQLHATCCQRWDDAATRRSDSGSHLSLLLLRSRLLLLPPRCSFSPPS